MKPTTLFTARASVLLRALLLPLLLACATAAQAAPLINTIGGDYAIHGYDTVAYFTEGRPTKGNEAFKAEYNEATWLFASAANRDKFAADPGAWAPKYGGYCAYGVSKGYAPDVDPTAWKIVDGKLYLNFNHSVQRRWEQNIPGYIATANKKWPGVLNR